MSEEFFKTRMGHKFYEHDVPRIADALEKIARHLTEEEKPVDDDDRKFVEQVWLLHHLDTRVPVDTIRAFSSEGAIRLHLHNLWQQPGGDIARAMDLMLALRRWDGQSTVVIGEHRLSTATVQL